MLSKCAVSAAGFLSLCLVVFVSPETKLPTAFEEYPDEPCVIKLTIRRFRLILSWELENKPSSPANYTLWYTVMSKDENLTKVENCSDITESSCDVTDEWPEGKENYYVIIVIVHRGDAMACHCSDYISPEDASLEPPEFEVVGFTDHINVMLEFPPITSKVILEKLMSTSLFIKEQTEDSFRMHKHKMKNVPGNFTYVLRDLLPKTNYCVSVYFNDEPVRESPLKCTVLQPGQESASRTYSSHLTELLHPSSPARMDTL
ncbi:interferon alpha/beta receptor 2 isoform X2 [Grammomys surdaster]|uniref:interferon alpha/beta receptor 2 isoform X2 n=1 Tax=Grammomys surdaster TaxID=491861 RepID=UPI0010A06478|nr:interferon alpha/beta receptor 2 isoform X2 [Grammomys surdaster]